MVRLLTLLLATSMSLAVTVDIQAQCAQCDDGCSACAATPAACCAAPQCQAAGRCCGGPRCVGRAELVDVEKHCWKVECEEICIPAVRFPWEHGGNKLTLFSLFRKKGCGQASCCDSSCDGGCSSGGGCSNIPCGGCAGDCDTCVPPKCGFVKTIRDLKKETYKKKVCEYSISVAESGDSACDCAAPGGCATCASQPMEMTPSTTGYLFPPQQEYETHPQSIPSPASTQPQVAPSKNLFQSPPSSPSPSTTIPVGNEVPAKELAPNMPSAQSSIEKMFRLVSRKQTDQARQPKARFLNSFKPNSTK